MIASRHAHTAKSLQRDGHGVAHAARHGILEQRHVVPALEEAAVEEDARLGRLEQDRAPADLARVHHERAQRHCPADVREEALVSVDGVFPALQGEQRMVCKQVPQLAENGGIKRDPLFGPVVLLLKYDGRSN